MAALSTRRRPDPARVLAPAAGVVAGTGLAVLVLFGIRESARQGDAGEATARRSPPAQVSVSLRSAQPDAAGAERARPLDPPRPAGATGEAGSALRPLFAAHGAIDQVAWRPWPERLAPVVVLPTPAGGIPLPPPVVPTVPVPERPPVPPTDPPTDPSLPDPDPPAPPAEPGYPAPGASDPGTADPGDGAPVPDPGTVDGGTTDPGLTDPGPAEPDPGMGDPGGSGDPDGTLDPGTDPTTATDELGTDASQLDVPAT